MNWLPILIGVLIAGGIITCLFCLGCNTQVDEGDE